MLDTLPDELISAIIQYSAVRPHSAAPSWRELARLCLVNQRIRRCAQPTLWRFLALALPRQRHALDQAPTLLSSLATHLHVHVHGTVPVPGVQPSEGSDPGGFDGEAEADEDAAASPAEPRSGNREDAADGVDELGDDDDDSANGTSADYSDEGTVDNDSPSPKSFDLHVIPHDPLDPVKEDLGVLDKLSNVQHLWVYAATIDIEDTRDDEAEMTEFTCSTLVLEFSESSVLERLTSLHITHGLLELRNLDLAAPLRLVRLALGGYLYSKTDLKELLNPRLLPNLRSLRLAPNHTYKGSVAARIIALPELEPVFLSQLDLFQIEEAGLSIPRSYLNSTTPTLCGMYADFRYIQDVQYLHLHDSSLDSFARRCILWWRQPLPSMPRLEAVFLPLRKRCWNIRRNPEDSLRLAWEGKGVKIIEYLAGPELELEEWIHGEVGFGDDFVLPEFEAYIKAKRGPV
ncbi:hypothetical protein NBRC10512_002314 [Rhodotorula toruloides]|uniref:RHTO0S08e05930g1_1 n=2 Tax=Rhodotorula toruloides TaxID=5286 RepID=A0A061B2W0_RHOTO|nr:uncharacterized protein RHTO_00998 [Rhodotorula toruloides NP11]EMS22244.1 hypothetical protein RHTO_00998 [Rhodotorula toruloides NP11]CDR43801.1 RHTO0S08e05930g1_1 [Rhodotorula toruloides]